MLYVQAEGYSKVEDKSVMVEVCGESEEAKSFQALLQQDQSGTGHSLTRMVKMICCVVEEESDSDQEGGEETSRRRRRVSVVSLMCCYLCSHL